MCLVSKSQDAHLWCREAEHWHGLSDSFLRAQIVYLAPDKTGRPILLYRAAEHWPGVQDPKEYTRYILYQTEKTRLRIGLGIDRQSCVLVDRVGSGRKNQDPALLQVSFLC